MFDGCGRTVDYLRVSITDRCNLRCIYCRPPGRNLPEPESDRLRAAEISDLVALFVESGVRRVRITGGEPLVRPDVAEIVAGIRGIPGVEEISLSTNGVLLAETAPALARAGLTRVNASLDTLRPERFRAIAGAETMRRVLDGIEAADAAGLGPVKVNTVLLRKRNDDEILDLARLTLDRPWHVRFIELMPVAWNREFHADLYVPTSEVLNRLQEAFPLETPEGPVVGGGPARYWRIRGAAGLIGLISPMCESFCSRCNRVRMTSTGRIRSCLFGDGTVDLAGPYRAGAPRAELRGILRDALAAKPEGHRLLEPEGSTLPTLCAIGG